MYISRGSVANAGRTVQTSATKRNPSRVCSSAWRERVTTHKVAPLAKVISTAFSYAGRAASPYPSDTQKGSSMARAKTTIKTLSTLSTGSGLTMVPASGSDEAGADLEELLYLGQEFLVGDEDDQVVLGEHHGVVMGHDHLVAAHDCGDCGTLGQVDFLYPPADAAAGIWIPVHHGLERLGHAAAQAVHPGHVAAPHVGEQRADGRLRGRNRDIDLTGLEQVDVGAPVDERDHAARAHALREQAGHDVVLVVIGYRDEEVHIGDVFGLQESFVRDVSLQHERPVEAGRKHLAASLVVLNDLDRVVALYRPREAQSDVAAPRNHDSPYRLVHAPQLVHDLADVFRRGETKHFISGLHHRIALGQNRAVTAKYGGDARVHGRNVLPEILQGMTDQGTALECTHCDQAHFAVSELEHLQCFRKLDELDDVIGKNLLRTDCQIDVEAVRAEYALGGKIVGGAQANDAGRDVEQLLCQLARDQIGLIALRHRNHHVAVLDTRLDQHRGVRGAAEHGAQIEAVLEVAQPRAVDIHDRDVVGFGHQVFRDRRADLASAEDDDFQGANPREKVRILCRLVSRVSLLFARRECRVLSTCGTGACARGRFVPRRVQWSRSPVRDDARSRSARKPRG